MSPLPRPGTAAGRAHQVLHRQCGSFELLALRDMLDCRVSLLDSRFQHSTLFLLLKVRRDRFKTFVSILAGHVAIGLVSSIAAAEIDESKLPPPAQVEIRFVRDIKPILD